MTKQELMDKVKRRLGYPMIKVELDDSQIFDHIDYARNQYIKWAVDNDKVSQEVYLTIMLLAGTTLYDLPSGVIEVYGHEFDTTGVGGMNTLFTVENYLYQQGAFDILWGGGNTLVSYHVGLDFLKTLKRYTVSEYSIRYHPYTNQLEVIPAPPSGSSLTYNGTTYDSPGFIMLKTYMIEGSIDNDDWSIDSFSLELFGEPWILDYVTALSKITLGRIRSKFANFSSMGNSGIALDGSELISEGKEEKEDLDQKLRDEEPGMGYGIFIG